MGRLSMVCVCVYVCTHICVCVCVLDPKVGPQRLRRPFVADITLCDAPVVLDEVFRLFVDGVIGEVRTSLLERFLVGGVTVYNCAY